MSNNLSIGNYRWTICALVFFATTINYLDRQVISLLKPYLESAGMFGSDPSHHESVYANIVIAFQFSFAIGMLLVGRIIDLFGTKLGYALSLFAWSIAAIAHAFAKNAFGFGVARAALGFPEAGNYPAAVKTIAEWFPQKERSFATGIFISGTSIGAILAPIMVPWIAETLGWKWAFIITGAIGMVWLFFWKMIYESPASKVAKGIIKQSEYDYINADEKKSKSDIIVEEKVSWLTLFKYRQTWAIFIGKFLTDPVWWFFLFWLPAFLKEEYGLKGLQVSVPIALVYVMTTIGSIFGGWLPKYFIEKGLDPSLARKRAMFFYSLFPVLVLSIQYFGRINMWYAVFIIGVAGAAHQAWSANIYTNSSDMFPKHVVASVTGIGGLAGAAGAMLLAKIAGALFDHYKALGDIRIGYGFIFTICASAYIVAWLLMHLLAPSFEQVDLSEKEN